MKYVCTGRVHPERADIRFTRAPIQLDGGGTAIVSCDSSQFTVALNDVPRVDGFLAAQLIAVDIANIFVGSLGFSLGLGYSVELVQVTEEDGTPHVFGVQPVGATLQLGPQQQVFNKALFLSGKNVFFRLAVRDYLHAMVEVMDCATYCYRAIEAIRQAFATTNQKDSWDAMHKALGTDRKAVKDVGHYAAASRHGDWINAKVTDAAKRWELLSTTRDVLFKYMEHVEPSPISTVGIPNPST